MKFWKTKIVRVGVIATVALVLVLLFTLSGLHPKFSKSNVIRPLTGDTLNCTILIDNKLNPGNPALKFTTDLIRQFSENNHCKVEVGVEKSTLEVWEDLTNGQVDVIIFNAKTDSIPEPFRDYLTVSIPVEKDYHCVMRYDDDSVIDNVNFWIAHVKPTPEYKRLYAKLHRLETTHTFSLPMTRYSISPYDNLVKKYAAQIGWDWKLLSALIFKESGWNTGVVSRMGAVGLMQVLQSIANSMGVEDIYDPEQNIRAGCSILAKTQKTFKAQGMDDENALLFTLASYNAGEGRILQCQKIARAEGKNPLIWAEVAEVIPLMINGYSKDGVNVSSFKGAQQTLDYPKKVMSQYEIYKKTVAE